MNQLPLYPRYLNVFISKLTEILQLVSVRQNIWPATNWL